MSRRAQNITINLGENASVALINSVMCILYSREVLFSLFPRIIPSGADTAV